MQESAAGRRGVPMAFLIGALIASAALPLLGLLVAAERVSSRLLADVTSRIGGAAAEAVASSVETRLRAAEEAILDVQAAARAGLVAPPDRASVASALRAVLVRRPGLAEATFTAARLERDAADGSAVLAADGRWQLAAERARDGATALRTTLDPGGGFVETTSADPSARPVPDPTRHLTFTTPASAGWRGRIVWSDLHRTALDAALPEAERRVVVAAQCSIEDADGRFAGVLRVSLTAGDLGALLADSAGDGAPGVVLLCDRDGRLIASAGTPYPLAETEDGLRAAPQAIDADVASVLREALSAGRTPHEARVPVCAGEWTAAVRPLEGTQDWLAVVALPEDAYAAELSRARLTALVVAGAAAAVVVGAAAWMLRAAGRALSGIAEEANRLRRLDFAPVRRRAAVREVGDVLDGLDRAKTALRALGRFVPVDLVRGLVADGTDPRPGGEVREVSVLFSDIEGFTTLAETMPPDAVAALTSDSLASATSAIHATGGVVDKFIGDSVMALWNAPVLVADHAARACVAALAARDAELRLIASPAWEGRPRIRTRFGIHTGRAVVGNIGSPERLNYTAVGDNVNLASRLEGLNKVYGTSILVSDAVRLAAGDRFAFRLVDRVTVAGRTGSVLVHELLGPPGTRSETHDRYERAFAAYERRDFAPAAEVLRALRDDPASAVLAARCERYASSPPADGWDGTFAPESK